MANAQYQIGRHHGTFDASAQRDVLNSEGTLITTLTGAADALNWPGNYAVNSSGVDAMTLAQPTAGDPQSGGDDGKTIVITDVGGHAHTITTAANGVVNNKHQITFNATPGSTVTLQAWNGIWLVLDPNGVAIA